MYLLVVTAASQNESLSQALHNAPWQINLITKIEMPHRGFTGCQGVCLIARIVSQVLGVYVRRENLSESIGQI